MDDQKKPVVLIYYRDIPVQISTFLAENKKFSCIKDGSQRINGHNAPRLTIQKEPESIYVEEAVFKKLGLILQELESNNQIIAFRFIEKTKVF